MRLIATRRVNDEMTLGEDVHCENADGTPLLRAGTKLSAAYTKSLLEHGINAVYVEDAVSAGIVVPRALSTELKSSASKTVAKAMSSLRELKPKDAGLGDQEIAELTAIAALIAEHVAGSAEVGMALIDLSTTDDQVYEHSVNVTALGLLIGDRLLRTHGFRDWEGKRSFEGIQARIVRLGLGLLLHDIGKMAIPKDLADKKEPLTAEETAFVRRHPVMGCDMLRGDTVTPLVKAVVRSHHERWDGAGYPDGKRGEDINQLARIASVANFYDAIVSARPGSPMQPPEVGWRAVIDARETRFDPLVVDTFRELVAPWPIGTEVLLSDGRRGIVASVPKGQLDRPTVRVVHTEGAQERAGVEIPLLEQPDLQITGTALDPPLAGVSDQPGSAAATTPLRPAQGETARAA